ncbi:DoxX family protein [Candidatus Pacebacteria bacterium]|nr:DoxX family protein [Candidatus Paceibacterota bacterium]
MDIFVHGLGWYDMGLLLIRITVGVFFAISGFHKLFVAERHEQLKKTLEACGIPYISFCCWFVPGVELFAGLGVLFGFLAPLAALGIAVIMIVALFTEGPRRIEEFKPINGADYLDDLFYLSETTYLIMAVCIIIMGPGSFSLDRFLLHMF